MRTGRPREHGDNNSPKRPFERRLLFFLQRASSRRLPTDVDAMCRTPGCWSPAALSVLRHTITRRHGPTHAAVLTCALDLTAFHDNSKSDRQAPRAMIHAHPSDHFQHGEGEGSKMVPDCTGGGGGLVGIKCER